MRFVLIVMLAMLAGCGPMPIDATVDAPVLSPPVASGNDLHKKTTQSAGPQSAGDHGVNIGNLQVDGIGFVAACVAIVLLLIKARRSGQLAEVLTGLLHNAGMTKGMRMEAARQVCEGPTKRARHIASRVFSHLDLHEKRQAKTKA